jgi:O-antigen ligase
VATSGLIQHSDSHAHNSYLHFLAELGVVGLGLFLGLWYLVINKNLRVFQLLKKKGDSSYSYILSLVAAASVIDLMVLSFTEHYMAAPTVMIIINSLVGMSMWAKKTDN